MAAVAWFVRPSHRSGLLVPANAKTLRARTVTLKSGQVVEWHTTAAREELLIALRGTVQMERRWRDTIVRRPLRAGHCAFLPRATWHRIVNRSHGVARYIYVTAPRG